ncbi:11319_t:CDS:10 [Dentiscutata erythropus]|uniref:Translation initiation factor IF-2, mitochondrial n=1 Tax=Dentiscutata erythropus TaxID=1348616 RepID=A0A9N8WGK1_9GLOM|nr:11319_t:CDS:10 [Dentiscutata erythropus]
MYFGKNFCRVLNCRGSSQTLKFILKVRFHPVSSSFHTTSYVLKYNRNRPPKRDPNLLTPLDPEDKNFKIEKALHQLTKKSDINKWSKPSKLFDNVGNDSTKRQPKFFDDLFEKKKSSSLGKSKELLSKMVLPVESSPVERPKKVQQVPEVIKKIQRDIFIPEAISVSNLAKIIGVRLAPFEHKLRSLGIEYTTHDHLLNSEEASLIAMEYDLNPIVDSVAAIDLFPKTMPKDMSIYPPRPPIVTIMGHVDHGKTTLLDTLRKSSVAAGEVGGITQHIGAFSVSLPSQKTITFLDTPGHAAFSAMRARGAHVTDIVVLVVAADDGVMPQTLEAIKHAKDAGVPIIVAINKIDKHDADSRKVRDSFMKHGIELEEVGGDTQCVEISALTGKGLDTLEEAIITLAELNDYRAEVDIEAEGVIIESQIEKGKGNVATALVKRGTLKQGDIIVAGTSWCKVRMMSDDKGQSLKQAPPGTPVKIMGWRETPNTGDEVLQAIDEELAKTVVANRQRKIEREKQIKDLEIINEKRRQRKKELEIDQAAIRSFKRKVWMFHRGMIKEYPTMTSPPSSNTVIKPDDDKIKELRIVVKGDVSGSIEAIVDSLDSIGNEEVHVNVVDFGVGDISESDVQMAAAAQGAILGFNVKVEKRASSLAQAEHVEIMCYNIIYKLLDDIKNKLSKMLPPVLETVVSGEATVLQVFQINVKNREFRPVAGCRITNGSIFKNHKVRIIRNNKQIWEGSLESLKHLKQDVTEAKKGLECGISFDGFTDFKEGDLIQSIVVKEIPRTL